ncbi:unnamed protein product [Caenorhabditis angaria]|uniref:F-box domain-containing protein n=1 Tax=Caenorhabditis angaria TaxID=860376 RepID=A0A9P1N1N2_9PELO|nr:unnamed protein product [Caenorhabditis angaria]
MLAILLTIYDFLNYNFMKIYARLIEEKESPIKKLPPEILGAIFAKLEFEDVQNFKNSSKFLWDSHKLERWMIAGPTCDANVYYNKNKELRLEITIMEKTRIIPFDQWNYYFKNSKCNKFSMTVEEEEIPLELLKKMLCCKSIEISIYSGKSINQMTIDTLSAYKPQNFEIVMNDWNFKIQNCSDHKSIFIRCPKNIEDVVEAIKYTYNSMIRLYPEIYEKNEDSLMKCKSNTENLPRFSFHFAPNSQQKVRSIGLFLTNSLSDVYGFDVGCRPYHFAN